MPGIFSDSWFDPGRLLAPVLDPIGAMKNHRPSVSDLIRLWNKADDEERDILLTDLLFHSYPTLWVQNS